MGDGERSAGSWGRLRARRSGSLKVGEQSAKMGLAPAWGGLLGWGVL